ncbi:hypothetical protein HZH66_013791 [Vespula vulgaris]|uniref:Uncharacterized protein n=1 Tax=Vespula vulgaris TaxID=7454 RepID=A0A834J4Q7_VESVU|nr:hypothetical protein HZH66_013791 [Vespula vulgaris]
MTFPKVSSILHFARTDAKKECRRNDARNEAHCFQSSSVEGHRALCSPQRDVYFGVGVLTRMLDLAIKSKSVSKALEREYLEMTRAAESTLDQRFLSHLDDNDNEFLSPFLLRSEKIKNGRRKKKKEIKEKKTKKEKRNNSLAELPCSSGGFSQ